MSAPGSMDPPAKKPKKGGKVGMIEAAMANQKTLDEIREASEGLLFFDHQSASTQQRRKTSSDMFEAYCKIRFFPDTENPTPQQMWNKETFAERCKDVIFLYASEAKGQIGAKPKAGVLFQLRDGLYWWASRHIKDFFSIFGDWHAYTTAAIHKAATMYAFETGWREKNNLTDAELNLFWAQIQAKKMVNIENWRQHYVAWLFMWVTSTRPGSITVGYGFEAGSIISQGNYRKEAETLRWKDLRFFRVPEQNGGGVGVKILLRYQKGFRVPHTQKMVSGQRNFTILPLRSDRYHCDLALLLVSLAYSRGLFDYESLFELFNGDEKNIQQVPAVSEQAVFVASNQTGIPTRDPMHENSLNPKLREMCDLVGLFGRNTVYALRRGAIVDMRRKEGTEVSQEMATHVMQGRSIHAYDDIGLADMDLANIRNGSEVMQREALCGMFTQLNDKRFSVDDEEVLLASAMTRQGQETAGTMLKNEANRRVAEDEEVSEQKDVVKNAVREAKQLVVSKGVDVDLMANDTDVLDQLNKYIAQGQSDCQTALDKINEERHALHIIRRTVRRMITKDLRKKGLEDAQRAQRLASSGNRVGSRGQSTQQERSAIAAAGARNPFDRDVDELNALDPNADDDEDEQEDQDDEPALPDPFENVPEDQEIAFGNDQGDEPSYTAAGRLEFVKAFTNFKATTKAASTQNTGLLCIECREDPTVPYEKKDTTYSLSKLDQHLKSDYHTREKQIMRAFHINADGIPPKAQCPICKKMFVAKGFIGHIVDQHNDQLLF